MQTQDTPSVTNINYIIHPDAVFAAERCNISIVHRFMDKVQKPDSGCWIWTGEQRKTGPIVARGAGGTAISARKVSWMIHYGNPPTNLGRNGTIVSLFINPTCGNERCVNPAHFGIRKGEMMPAIDMARVEALLEIDPVQDPNLPTGFSRSFKSRFWAKVQRSTGCWLWTGGLNTHGYGCIGKGENQVGNIIDAHMASWLINRGPIPEGLEVMHECPGGENPQCVNPDHLRLGTHQENLKYAANERMDGVQAHWNARRVTLQDVASMREASRNGATFKELSDRYGIAPSYVSQIVHNKCWNRPGC